MVTLLDARPRHPEKANRPDAEVLRKPDWIRVRAPGSAVYKETQQIVRENNLVTVCEEAGWPQYRRVLVEKARHHDDHG